MRVMVIVKATEESEAGEMPKEELLADMMKFNQDLVNAGIMLSGMLASEREGKAREIFGLPIGP